MSNFIKKFFPVKLSKYIYIYDKRITYFIKKRLYTHIIHNIKNIKLNKYMYNILLKKPIYTLPILEIIKNILFILYTVLLYAYQTYINLL